MPLEAPPGAPPAGAGDPSADLPPATPVTAPVTASPAPAPSGRAGLLLAVLVALQAAWLSFLLSRGWYSSADLPNLAAANDRPLDWAYLSQSLGGHFGGPQRLVYWVLNRTAPLEWGVTVAIRVGLQVVATVLLWRLLHALVGRRRGVPVLVALYAASPLLVPGAAVLSSGLGLGLGQVCLLGALLAHVRYTRTGRLRDAVAVAGLVLVTLVSASQALVGVLLLPVLSLGFLSTGSLRARLGAALRRWPGWLLLGAALGGFAALYLSGDYNTGTSTFTADDARYVVRTTWLQVLGPALVGGPWEVAPFPEQWSAYARPPRAAVVLGQLALAGLVLASVRRTGPRALLAWSLPVVVALGAVLLVGVGRWAELEEFLPYVLRYSYYAPLALALGLALAFYATPETAAADPARRPADPAPGAAAPGAGGRRATGARAPRLRIGLAAAGVLGVLVGSAVSSLRFSASFAENPSREYVSALVASAQELGPAVQVHDVRVPEAVIPFLSPNHFVSDVLGLAGAPAVHDGPGPTWRVPDDDGRLVPSRFRRLAGAAGPGEPGCGTFVEGVRSVTVALPEVSSANELFLRLEVVQPVPNVVTIEVRDAAGRELPVGGGSSEVRLTGELAVAHRRLAFGVPASLTVRSGLSTTNLCLVQVQLGVPGPR